MHSGNPYQLPYKSPINEFDVDLLGQQPSLG
jgi:hypothetical protein